ncbi:nucleotidyltransferase family protein [Pontibacter sp. 13R65]|uniref:nucleotidyltransferase family protein n=1 Tax=Pontibacter sp. 13R65 TaxID=3127458 RepID=UPI00301C4398
MTGLVLLAAGASTRLGKPKQQLLFEGQTLLQRATQSALASDCAPIVVVLGAKADLLLSDMSGLSITTILNQEWQSGMASSISSGMAALMRIAPAVSACLIMVCDQPFVHTDLLNKLLHTKEESGKGIAACAYGGTMGTPAVFDKSYFQALLELKGQEGARKIISQNSTDVATVAFPQGATDIDTTADYDALLQTATHLRGTH